MTARGIFILPAEIETDVLLDDQPFLARSLRVAIPRIGEAFADEPRRIVAQKRFDGDETATDDQQVGLDDAVVRFSHARTSGIIRVGSSAITHIHIEGVMITQV